MERRESFQPILTKYALEKKISGISLPEKEIKLTNSATDKTGKSSVQIFRIRRGFRVMKKTNPGVLSGVLFYVFSVYINTLRKDINSANE
ncbi:hypothetical protein CEXT_461501 [Caerostris extrusa]|uniref:Uncharacterized protein n=1 Tax=Caerostris extrusa TaxID=172846 RepID=A0AAV4MYM0_CAEEX|nr:hypothetical protein CEXT_461501 [Caerostris extrusa]